MTDRDTAATAGTSVAGEVSALPALPRPSGRDAPQTIAPGPPAPPPGDEEQVMSLVGHLTELRRRIAISVFSVLVGTIAGFFLAPSVVRLLVEPVPGRRVAFVTLTGGFYLQLKIALVIGIALALPMVLYQLWAFVAPGLTARERRAARPWVPLTVLFFLVGVGVAYFTLPYAVAFLSGFQTAEVFYFPTAEAYFGFVTTLFLAFGFVMQFPIAVVLLSKLGILSPERLRSSRRYVFLAIFVFAVIATPGGDPVSPVVMGSIMYLMYEATLFILGRSQRPEIGR